MKTLRFLPALILALAVLTLPAWSLAQEHTEIGLINTSEEPVTGTLRIMNAQGQEIGACPVTLEHWAKKEFVTGQDACLPRADVSYAYFESSSGAVVGYSTITIPGWFRLTAPLAAPSALDELDLSHIAYGWETFVLVINATAEVKDVNMVYNTGDISTTMTPPMAPGEMREVMIVDYPELQSATITNAQGTVAFNGYFYRDMGDFMPLTGETSTNLVFPHVAHNNEWWTGIVIYNPSPENANLNLHCFGMDGSFLGTVTPDPLAPGANLVAMPDALGLPEGTEWFAAQSNVPVTGLVLYGTIHTNQLAGISVTNIEATDGVFPKLETDGWTGIALVNPHDEPAEVRLFAEFADRDSPPLEKELVLGPYAKVVGMAQQLFDEDISEATSIDFVVDSGGPLVGLQINGSSDMHLLEGLAPLQRFQGNKLYGGYVYQ